MTLHCLTTLQCFPSMKRFLEGFFIEQKVSVMVLTSDQKAVIKNDFEEKGWSSYKIWKEHPSFKCSKTAVTNLVNKIKETGSADRRYGSGRPVTACCDSNAEEVEELICSQEDLPGSHYSVREIASHLDISKSSVQRIVKRKKLKAFKRVSTPQMNQGCRKRRQQRASNLANRFSSRFTIARLVFQDEKDFTLQVQTNKQNNRVYSQGCKRDVKPERLFHEGNKFTLKVMVSAVFSWKGVSKPYFVGDKDIKVNSSSYLKHLKKDLIPSMERMYPKNDFIFVQDSAPSHRANIVQGFLSKNSINVSLKALNGLLRHQIVILWITFSGIKCQKKFMQDATVNHF